MLISEFASLLLV